VRNALVCRCLTRCLEVGADLLIRRGASGEGERSDEERAPLGGPGQFGELAITQVMILSVLW
jgi:hypothetical protein